MPIGNDSGRNVEYEVEPSNPGGNLTAPITASLLFTATGGAFTAAGCLTDLGGTGLTVIGLFLLAAALVSEAVALNRASVASSPKTPVTTLLADGDEHAHTFVPGTWVAFFEVGEKESFAVSPPVLEPGSTVRLRRCDGQGGRLTGDGDATFVEVVPPVVA